MRQRGDYWQFFTYDTETKYVSCKFCSKKYKTNATRMQEHLITCKPFRTSAEAGLFDSVHSGSKLKSSRKNSESSDNRDQIVNIENIHTSDVSGFNENINSDSDLISVEHGYNSEMTTTKHNLSFLKKKRKKDILNHSASNQQSYVTSDEFRDEFDTFGEHVANELRKLKQNPVLLANTKHELNNILHKALIENFKNEEFVSVFIN